MCGQCGIVYSLWSEILESCSASVVYYSIYAILIFTLMSGTILWHLYSKDILPDVRRSKARPYSKSRFQSKFCCSCQCGNDVCRTSPSKAARLWSIHQKVLRLTPILQIFSPHTVPTKHQPLDSEEGEPTNFPWHSMIGTSAFTHSAFGE